MSRYLIQVRKDETSGWEPYTQWKNGLRESIEVYMQVFSVWLMSHPGEAVEDFNKLCQIVEEKDGKQAVMEAVIKKIDSPIEQPRVTVH